MLRKTSFVAAAAAMFLAVFSAEGSGARAQQGPIVQLPEDPVTEETVPVFVSNEVVQPLSEDSVDDDSAFPEADSLRELVAEMPRAGALSDEMECLAGAIYFESRGEPLAGQLAVGQVIINRAESGTFPSDYCGVVFQPSQFSFVRHGRMPRIDRTSASWARATAIARIAHEGLWDSEAGDALYFHAKYVHPSWSRTKIARATIDTHIFYR
jgi:spore germination cell wall hydrolase CwlJ-like protein